MPEELGF